MRIGDRTYTRIIRWLKVALPLLALALLSTMFMLSRKIDPTAAIALSDQAFRDRIENSQLSGPRYAGNTNSGKPIVLTARSARPDKVVEGKTYGQQVHAAIDMDNGEVMTITAETSVVDEGEDLAVLNGNVHIVTTDGYDFKTSQLTALLSKIEGESAGEVNGFGPTGTLNAGKMFIRMDEQNDKINLIFTQGVHLVYNKKKSE